MNKMYSPYANTMTNACKRHRGVHDTRTTRAAAARKRGVNLTTALRGKAEYKKAKEIIIIYRNSRRDITHSRLLPIGGKDIMMCVHPHLCSLFFYHVVVGVTVAVSALSKSRMHATPPSKDP